MTVLLAIAAGGALGTVIRQFVDSQITHCLVAIATFSIFSLKVAVLYERRQMMPTAGYVAPSVVLAVGGLFAELALVRAVAA